MKATFKLFAIIAFLTVSGAALANVDKADKEIITDANIIRLNNDMVYVQLKKSASVKLNIVVKDQVGNVLHTEIVKGSTEMLKRFDISKLPSGIYTYEVYNKDYSLSKRIERE